MPANPERGSRGGDVSGSCKTDNQWGVGSPVEVADASYEPGYEIEGGMGYASRADLKQGYISYGVGIGEGRPKGMIGGGRK
jgi:hypothetical protein